MRPLFPLFQSHLDLAHHYWKQVVKSGDLVVDATCGNGHDAQFLATLVSSGQLLLIDIQEQALQATRDKLQQSLSVEQLQSVSLHNLCHSRIDEIVSSQSAKLIVFNLGYLPGQNKAITTLTETTLMSLEKCLDLVCPSGVISITCYPGHEEGKRELHSLLDFCKSLPPTHWSVSVHAWMNRREHPQLLLLQKAAIN